MRVEDNTIRDVTAMTPEEYFTRKRKVHLDMHLPQDAPHMFERFDAAEYVSTLVEANVNSVTVFAHCHHGNCYYNTAVGHKHSRLDFDYLREVATECRRQGVAVLAYISCAWNHRAGEEHSEWTQRDAEGQPRPHPRFWWWMCLNSPYGDLIREMTREIASEYPVDGLWFDITYVHPPACYCDHCQGLFRERFGVQMPRDAEPGTHDARRLHQFRIGTEMAFREDLVEIVKAADPELLISWNHAGDVTQCYLDNDSRADVLFREAHTPENWLPGFQARWFQWFDMPYECCTSRFHYGGWSSFSYKSAAKLHIEAATGIAHGGIVDIGDQALHDGTLDDAAYELIGEVYERIRAVEPWCAGTCSVPNIAVLHSSRAHHLAQWMEGSALRRPLLSVFGAARILSDAGRHFDIISERVLDRLPEYHAALIPDQLVLTEEEVAALRSYVRDGGALIASWRCGMYDENGEQLSPTFLRELCGVEPMGFAPYSCGYLTDLQFDIDAPDAPLVFRSPGDPGNPVPIPALECEGTTARVMAGLTHPIYERTPQHFYAANNPPPADSSRLGSVFLNRLGDGAVVYFPFDLFRFYQLDSYPPLRTIATTLLDRVAPDQELWVDAPSQVEVVLRARQESRYIHLINYANQRFGQGFSPVVVEDIIPVSGIPVRLRGEAVAVMQRPSGRPIPFAVEDGWTCLTLPRLDVHAIIQVRLPQR
ncbi:MAG: alpha-amylase family protein [Armatimonadota bacterium]|nr:alpha-amylase family protein [Armatimonadota bacterium]